MSHTPTVERGEKGGRRDVCSSGATRQATPAFWQVDLEIACVNGSPGQRVESGFHTARTRTAIHPSIQPFVGYGSTLLLHAIDFFHCIHSFQATLTFTIHHLRYSLAL